jgi:hypothetical protein
MFEEVLSIRKLLVLYTNALSLANSHSGSVHDGLFTIAITSYRVSEASFLSKNLSD